MINFTHLHVHTQYSILDGASSIPVLMGKAKKDGMKAIAITDHGNMFGVKDFHNHAKKAGIKPIIGCEAYVASKSRFNKSEKEDRGGHHLILLAQNKKGYENLVKLVSYSWTEGFYYKPRVDKELLKKYNEGIIASSACLGGELPQAIMNHGDHVADETISEFKSIFGDNYYLEIQRHKSGNPVTDRDVYDRQQMVNAKIIELAQKHQVKIIATNDVHFVNAEDAEAHDRLICLNTGKDLDDPDRMRYTTQEYFKTQKEMFELYKDIPEALENTNEIVDKIEEYELNRPPIMPDFPLPDGFDTEDDYLKHITYEGAKKRYGEITDEIKERLDFELSVVEKMGFPGYFLIVQDFLNAARDMGVSVGPGRGSAAGSVVAYCTKITDIDPLKYNLLFERFLNPDRISMPDIDIDFDEDGREKVIEWVVEKYGEKRVAQIITFGTMAAKMAIRDVARVQKLPLSDADKLAKLVPEKPGTTLSKAYSEVPELKAARTSDNELISQTLKFAETLEGSVRHTGLHACGIIIGKNDLEEYIPISTSKDSKLIVTQFDGKHVEDVGMLKMDFLGLKTLSIIMDALENIKASKGIDIDLENISLEDKDTYELYARGETTGLFQFESLGMKKHLRGLKPNRFEDLIAMNALYRPGPMEYIPSFINRKHGKEKIEYDLPEMEEYLEDTYGITVYQEQVMLLSQKLAGFSKGQADSLRKAMGKKKKDVMDQLKEKFVEGCSKNGYQEKIIKKIWNDWEAFAQYAFNKSHSTCYAQVSYHTAYLKAHYPGEFMSAVLSRNITDIKKITIFMDECKRMGIHVLGPDVNESKLKFTVNKNGDIRFGLGAIKGVGEAAVFKIIEEREENGNFESIFDFVSRVSLQSVNKKSIEALAISGGYDNLEDMKRSQYFGIDSKGNSFIENLIKYGNKVQIEKSTPQQSLFGEAENFELATPEVPNNEDWSKLEKLNKEKELIGIYLSAHPLDDYRLEIDNFCNVSVSQFSDLQSLFGRDVTFAGIVTGVRHATTKTGKPFGSITVEDYTDSYNIMMFGKDYENFRKYFYEGYTLLIKAKIRTRMYNESELELSIRSICMLTNVRDEMIKNLVITVSLNAISDAFVNQLIDITESNKGNVLLKLKIIDPSERQQVELFSRTHRVNLSNQFIDYLKNNSEIEFKVN